MNDKVISEVLDRKGFGSNVQLVAEDEGCKVLRLEAPTGEGFMSLYLVMPGIYVMFNDFHLIILPATAKFAYRPYSGSIRY